ncbi:MAG: DUF5658 family protein [bacterium]|nr:DUF5658 family protein [bacterium]
MGLKDIFKVVQGETEHITYTGKRIRKSTVLIKVGSLSFSKKAFLLGGALAMCQLFDGFLTYLGLEMQGLHMERNTFLRELMRAYGMAPVLVIAKFLAVVLVIGLTTYAHRRKWIRPLIAALVGIYLVLAVVPWMYIIVSGHSQSVQNRSD